MVAEVKTMPSSSWSGVHVDDFKASTAVSSENFDYGKCVILSKPRFLIARHFEGLETDVKRSAGVETGSGWS